jgi:hypothetical protein
VSAPSSYQYAVVRVVPRVDRDEFINAGVIVFSPQHRFLQAEVRVDEDRLRALWPSLDIEGVKRHVQAIPLICAGDSSAGAIAKMSKSERFHWLTSPRSTVIQMSPVRTGISDDPEEVLRHLACDMVSVPAHLPV